jgi:hypothetical protein
VRRPSWRRIHPPRSGQIIRREIRERAELVGLQQLDLASSQAINRRCLSSWMVRLTWTIDNPLASATCRCFIGIWKQPSAARPTVSSRVASSQIRCATLESAACPPRRATHCRALAVREVRDRLEPLDEFGVGCVGRGCSHSSFDAGAERNSRMARANSQSDIGRLGSSCAASREMSLILPEALLGPQLSNPQMRSSTVV